MLYRAPFWIPHTNLPSPNFRGPRDSSAHERERPGWFTLKENLTVDLLWCYCEAAVLIADLAPDPLPGWRNNSHTKVRVVRFRARMVRFHQRGLGIRFKAGTSFVDSNSRCSEFAHFTIQSHFRSSVAVKTWGWRQHETTFVTHFTFIQWHFWLKQAVQGRDLIVSIRNGLYHDKSVFYTTIEPEQDYGGILSSWDIAGYTLRRLFDQDVQEKPELLLSYWLTFSQKGRFF